MTDRHILLSLFFAFFALYLFSQALHPIAFDTFGMDSMEDLYLGRTHSILAVKHPLFLIVSVPVYQVGKLILSPVSGTLGQNLVLSFPVALFGATSVCLAYLVFLRRCPDRPYAVSFTLLYGCSASAWIFSSFPESYVLTALATTFVLWILAPGPNSTGPRFRLLVVATCAAAYASPTQISLAVIPCTLWLADKGFGWAWIRQSARFGALLILGFAAPYFVLTKMLNFGWKFAPVYLGIYGRVTRLADPNCYVVVAKNFLLYSVVGPSMEPKLYTQLNGPFAPALKTMASFLWLAAAILYGLLVASALRGLRNASRPWVASLAILLGLHWTFFTFFNPAESFLYSLPVLLVWLLILYEGSSRAATPVPRLLLAALILAAALNNAYLIRFLSSLH